MLLIIFLINFNLLPIILLNRLFFVRVVMEINNINSFRDDLSFKDVLEKEKQELKRESDNKSSKVWKAVDDYLNLGTSANFFNSGLSAKELEQSLKIIAKLIKKGVVGYNYYVVDGKVEKHFLVPSIGDERLSSAELEDTHYFDKYL